MEKDQGQANQFLSVIEESVMGNPITEIKQSGNSQGTWSHQKLALNLQPDLIYV